MNNGNNNTPRRNAASSGRPSGQRSSAGPGRVQRVGQGQNRNAPPRQAVQYVDGRGSVRNKSGSGQRLPAGNRALTRREANAVAKERKKDAEWEAGVQRVYHGVDRPMLVIILILLCLGTTMVFSASYPSALAELGDSTYYIRHQLLWLAIGGVAMICAAAMPYGVYKRATPSVIAVSIGLLVLVLVIGTARGVAQRWLAFGALSVQPSEVAKIAMIMALARYIDNHFDKTSTRFDKRASLFQGVLIPGAIMAIFCALVLLEKHLSGTIILGLIGACVIFLSGANVLYMALGYGIPALIIGIGYLMTNEYAMKRILTHSNDDADVLNEAWQTTQGLFAIGSGGVLGTGLGESNLKYNYVSEAQNDFIFTIWCEEMGLVGALILIALYGLFVWRGFTIAKKAPDTFSSLVAFGITCQVGIQALLNILVVTNIIPNTGVSLPFFSYGGSSLIMLMGEMGILLSISKHSYQKK